MKILYFYPENPILVNQGNNARALSLLNYFKDRKHRVDFVGEQSNNFGLDSILELQNKNLISKGFLLKDFNRKKNKIKYFFFYSLPNKIKGKIKDFDRTRFGQKNYFNQILKNNNYDFIIISYAYWASLIKDNKNTKNAKLIIDTHDFLTSQFQSQKNFNLGKYIQKEINILNLFDKTLVISNEEKYVFSQFCSNEVEIVTHSLPKNFEFKQDNKKYDLVYVASNNDHNIKSAKWFFNNVYPLLSKDIKICVVGRIGAFCPDNDNIEKIEYIQNLDLIYSVSKVAICPMLSGTGLKIKVIEAMSFGLPIVCNERGVDGLLNKTKNGCLVTNEAKMFSLYIEKLLKDNLYYESISLESEIYFSENHFVEAVYNDLDKVFKL